MMKNSPAIQRKNPSFVHLGAIIFLIVSLFLIPFKSMSIEFEMDNTKQKLITFNYYQNAQGNQLGNDDLAAIIQLCLDASDLQKYYPKNSDESLKQIVFVQYPVEFSTSLNISKGGSGIKYLSAEDKATTQESHFAFRRIIEGSGSVTVIGNYFYGYDSNGFKSVSIEMECEKSGSTWSLKNIKLGGDTK